MTAQALEWLDARESPPPAELRERMARALAGVTAETLPGALAEGALSCLQATMADPQDRETAQDLLAADALLTYALEAAAELGASTLRDIVQLYGPGTLASLVLEEPGAGTAPGDAPAPPAEAPAAHAKMSPDAAPAEPTRPEAATSPDAAPAQATQAETEASPGAAPPPAASPPAEGP